MKRFNIINHLIDLYGYNSYLEIGVSGAKSFKRIKVDDKDGVDPAGNCNYVMTSDDFFKQNKKKYDLIFIDGLHKDFQVLRDVENSLKFLNENGTIVMHDCNPRRRSLQSDEYITEKGVGKGAWTGTVWRAFARLRATRPDLYMKVVATDYGVGIVRRGGQHLLKINLEKLNYSNLRKRRKEILNLISPEEFLEEFKK